MPRPMLPVLVALLRRDGELDLTDDEVVLLGVEWAPDITVLTWLGRDLAGAISHAIALDFPHCCWRNNSWSPVDGVLLRRKHLRRSGRL